MIPHECLEDIQEKRAKLYPFVEVYKLKISVFQPEYYARVIEPVSGPVISSR